MPIRRRYDDLTRLLFGIGLILLGVGTLAFVVFLLAYDPLATGLAALGMALGAMFFRYSLKRAEGR